VIQKILPLGAIAAEMVRLAGGERLTVDLESFKVTSARPVGLFSTAPEAKKLAKALAIRMEVVGMEDGTGLQGTDRQRRR
jgi:hypothetical protein